MEAGRVMETVEFSIYMSIQELREKSGFYVSLDDHCAEVERLKAGALRTPAGGCTCESLAAAESEIISLKAQLAELQEAVKTWWEAPLVSSRDAANHLIRLSGVKL